MALGHWVSTFFLILALSKSVQFHGRVIDGHIALKNTGSFDLALGDDVFLHFETVSQGLLHGFEVLFERLNSFNLSGLFFFMVFILLHHALNLSTSLALNEIPLGCCVFPSSIVDNCH